MTVLHKHPGSYDEGAYGIVFFDEQGYAIKVFKRRPDAPEEHLKAVFQSEVEAYRIANESNELRALVPEFFGVITCEQVLDEAGNDISGVFHMALAYKMRKIEGVFRKCGLQDEKLKGAFSEAGIRHTKDASVLFEDGAIRCIVDIAVQEHELWHQCFF